MDGKAVIVQADVGAAADRARLVDEAYAAFGRIDQLVNNAGVAPAVRADLLEASEESFDRLININLKGPYFLTQLVARRMIDQGTGTEALRHEGTKGNATDSSSSYLRASVPSCLPKIINITSVSAYT